MGTELVSRFQLEASRSGSFVIDAAWFVESDADKVRDVTTALESLIRDNPEYEFRNDYDIDRNVHVISWTKHIWMFTQPMGGDGWTVCLCGFRPMSQIEMDAHIVH